MGSENNNNKKKLGVCKVNVFYEIREHLEAWFSVHLQQYNAGASLMIYKAKSHHRIWNTRYTVTAEASVRLHVDATYKMYLKKYLCQLA